MIIIVFLVVCIVHLVNVRRDLEDCLGQGDASGFFYFWLNIISLGLFVYFATRFMTFSVSMVGA